MNVEAVTIALILIVLGVISIFLGFMWNVVELVPVAIPLIVIPSILLASTMYRTTSSVIHKMFCLSLVFVFIIELLVYFTFNDISGKSISMGIILGLMFYGIYMAIYGRKHGNSTSKTSPNGEECGKENNNVNVSGRMQTT